MPSTSVRGSKERLKGGSIEKLIEEKSEQLSEELDRRAQ